MPAPVTLDPLDLLDKLALLEERMGASLQPEPLAPFPLAATDPIALQKATRRIAEHVGLGDHTFIVAVSKQEEGAAGHIELDASQDVFVEVDHALLGHPDTVLACLAHEVCHKLLQVHGVFLEGGPSGDVRLENERLTDLAAIWAGFGKLMLNGCQYRVETPLNEHQVQVSEHRGGYLTRESLGLAYLIVHEGRGAKRDALERTLRAEVLDVLREVEADHVHLLRPVKADTLTERVRRDQERLAAVEKEVRWLKAHLLPALEGELERRHRQHHETLGELEGLERRGEGPGALLRRARLNQRAIDLARSGGPLQRASAVLGRVGAEAWAPLVPERTAEMFRVVKCGACGGKLRLPPGRDDLIARCPRCSYRFSADTTAAARSAGADTPGRRSWWRRLFGS